MKYPFGLLIVLSLVSAVTIRAADAPSLDPKDLPRIPPIEATNALKTFQIKKGFHLELVAAEPLVMDPIAMSFDENGRMFVVEMRDYSEMRDVHPHLGRIRMLEDTNGDGVFDRATVYADDLPWPTSVMYYDGGIFVAASPDILYFKDTNGDGKADLRKIVFTGFGAGNGDRNRFYNMPPALVDIPVDGPAAEVYRISPEEQWRVIRTKWRVTGVVPGLIEGGGRASGYFTSATGITIFRGNGWPKEDLGDAFVADCGSNLVHRKKVRADGVALLAERPTDEQKVEFLASTDLWFRPVQLANAPDGTLYIADMYREVIEHPWSLPESIKKLLDLNAGNDRGRIYRIVPDTFKQPKLPRLSTATTKELVALLNHPNGWHRDTAARLLCERQDKSAAPLLEQVLKDSKSQLARMHALYALDGLGGSTQARLLNALSDESAVVR